MGSISERPCHAVTISGFFWSAKFFQIRNAPSSGETRERERYRVRERARKKNAAWCKRRGWTKLHRHLFVIFMHFKVLNCVDENPEPRLFHTHCQHTLLKRRRRACNAERHLKRLCACEHLARKKQRGRNLTSKPLRLKHGKDTEIKHVRALL